MEKEAGYILIPSIKCSPMTFVMRFFQIGLWMAMDLPAPAQSTAPAKNSGAPDFRQPTYPGDQPERIQQYKGSRASGMNQQVSQDAYDSLSLREQFVYAMICPEQYPQHCASFHSFFQRGKPFPRLSFGYNEHTLSSRQVRFLKMHRHSVTRFISALIQQRKSWGINIKQAIIEINGWEFIPAMMVLMANDVFSGFVQSGYYQRLYGATDSYHITIDADKTTETFILNTTMDYYKSRTGKRSLKTFVK